jgi:hypothetical protein
MKKTLVVSVGLVGCRRKIEFEVDDDATPESIDDEARDIMLSEVVEWWVEDADEEDD